jgi:hypothetical protein
MVHKFIVVNVAELFNYSANPPEGFWVDYELSRKRGEV